MDESSPSPSAAAAVRDSWQRLKERKVVQWTLAYIALAYSLLHGLELVGHGFDWPHVIYRVAAVLLILGVPIVGIVAWYHGDRAQRRVSTAELAILTVLLVIAGSLLWMAARPGSEHVQAAADLSAVREPLAASGPPTAAASAPGPSIAVVPFANLTGDPSKEYFSDGMADELINTLASVPGLRVPARTSSFAYKGRGTDVRKIARDLGVATVLEGSVRSAGERVRVTAQLVDARTGYHLWSHSYDRKFTDLFELQDELATSIVRAINTRMSSSLTAAPRVRSPTADLAAYETYLQAVEIIERPSEENIRQSIELYQRAIDRDPRFARAFAGRAFALITSVLTGATTGLAVRDAVAGAARDAERAVALDPSLTSAHVALGVVSALRGRHVDAQAHFRTAFALDDNDPNAHRSYALFVVASTGRLRQALEETRTAYRLAPASVTSLTVSAAANSGVGRDEEAIDYIDMAVKLGAQPTAAPYPLIRANAAARAGRHAEAASHIISGLNSSVLEAGGREVVELVYAAYAEPRKRPAALAALQRLESNIDAQAWPISSVLLALWYTQLGDVDLAYQTVTRRLAHSMRTGTIGSEWPWYWLPELRAFRQDPRFEPLVTKLGFMEYWKRYGPPDDCELRDARLLCH